MGADCKHHKGKQVVTQCCGVMPVWHMSYVLACNYQTPFSHESQMQATKAEVIEHLNGRFSSFKNDFIVGWSDEVRKEVADKVQLWGKDSTDVSSLRTQVQMASFELELHMSNNLSSDIR